ncbi:beach domain-containing protein lvsc [Anaeramoeba ignava]|uniref:Beach domain-containing protein lvsc n=1 Tax=Anaeramoeba ignava TaxID=1746090 RepID=A0A9Q0R705_ANAIG|nr:beach domain-containing protein lvsc [Anaeramoeba ignava]
MSFFKGLFKKKSQNKTQQNIPSQTNQTIQDETEDNFIKHSPNGEKLKNLWEKRKQITDPEARTNWFFEFSNLFIESYKDWSPEDIIQNQNKNLIDSNLNINENEQNKTKKKDKKNKKNSEKEFHLTLQNAINNDLAHPTELITETMNGLLTFKELLDSHLEKESGINLFESKQSDILSANSLDMVDILIKSQFNRNSFENLFLFNLLVELANVANSYFKIFIADTKFEKTNENLEIYQLSPSQTKHQLLLQFLLHKVLKITCVLSNLNFINDLNTSLEKQLFSINSELKLQWIVNFGLLDYLIAFLDNSYHLSENFLLNHHQYQIQINLISILLNLSIYVSIPDDISMRITDTILNILTRPNLSVPKIQLFNFENVKIEKVSEKQKLNIYLKSFDSIFNNIKNVVIHENIFTFNQTFQISTLKNLEFQTKIIVLQTLRELIKENTKIETSFGKNSQFSRLCDLILWVAYSFPQDYVEEFTKNKQQRIQKKIEDMKAKEKEKTLLKIKDKQNTKTNQRSNSLNNSSFLRKNFIFPTNLQAFQTDLPQILQLSNPDDFSQPKNTTKPKFPHDIQTNHKLHRLFQVFRDICIESANNSLLIKEDNKNTNQKTIKENIGKKDLIQSDSNWENLQRWKSGLQSISRIKDQILCVCLDTFNYNFHKSYANREYRDFIRIISPDLQLEVFMLFSTILDQAALDILNEYNMWNIFCSDFFYYETNNYFIGPKPSLDLFHSLKGFMFDLISYVATNQIVSNIYECQILIKLIKDNAKNLNIVLECIKTLLSIMKNKLLITQESLQKLAAIDELCVLNFELQEEQIYLQLQKRKSNQNLSVDQEYIDNLKENHQNYLKRTKTFSSDLIYEIRFHIYDIINLFFSNPKIINKFIRNNKNSEFASIKILLNNLLEVKTRRFIMKQFQNIFVSTPKTKNHSWIDFYMLIIEFISRMHQTFINSYQEQTNKNIRYLILIRDFLQTLTLSIIQNQRALQSILVKVGIFKLTATLLSTQESSNKLIIDILRLLIQIFRANRKNIIYFNKDVGYKTLENLIAQSNYLEKADTIYNLLMNMVVNNNVFNKENDNKFKKDFNDNTFDQETNFIIQNPDVVPVLFRLYSQPNTEKLFLHLLETFIDICNKSIHNTSCCCDSGLISLLIDQIPILFIKKHLLPKAKREKEIQKSNQILIERVIGLLAILGSHYISVNELNLLFSHLKKFKSGAYSPYSHLFLLVLKKILSKRHAERRRQPKVFFDFDGRSSCLVFPKLEKWPLVHGYTFSTWMRIESFIDPLNKPNYEPRIFSFLTQNGQGIEAFFALRSKYSDKKDNKNIDSSEQKVMHLVEPKMDFVIKVTTNQSESDFLVYPFDMSLKQWRNKDIYIDGAQVFKSSLKYPSTTDHLIYNKIGSNFQINQSENQKQSTRENPFFGQMGTIYIFDDVLNANQISGIYQLGANYMWSFEEQSINPSLYPKLFEAQNQQSQTSKHKTVSFSSPVFSLFDGSLTDKLFVNFNSKACDFKYCFDQNPNPVIQKTKIVAMFKCVIRNLDDIIYCLGGIKLLFPLFFELSHKEMQFDFETLIKELEQRISSFNIREYFHKLQNQNEQNTKSIKNKNPNPYPFSEDPNTSNKIIDFITSKSENNFNENIFDLIADVLIGSPANQEDMISSSGFLILGNILEGLPPDYINEKFIKTIQTIILKSAKPELIEYLTHTFIFNFDIWIYTDYQIQNQIIQEIMDNLLIKKETIFFNRSKIHTQQIMNLLRLYYWLSPETYSIGIEPKKDNVSKNSNISWNRPKNEEVVNLRNNLLNLLKNKFQNHVGVEDIQSIIQYCIAMYDIMHTEEMKDVIIFFHDLIQNSENLMCKKVLERKKEANKLEKEQKRKTIIDTTKVKAKEGENDNQTKSSKKSKEEKNSIVSHDELHENDSSKVIEALSSIGYMDAFIVFLDIEDDSLRELFLHIIWHIDFFNENIQNKKKYTSRLYPESGYYIIHSILLKYKFTKKISQILFQMLLSTNHNFEEIIENNEEIKIQKPWILETIFQFIIKEPEHFYSLEIMQEILYLLKKSDYNCSVFIQQQMWQNWLIEMVDQNSLIENENENQK